MKEATLTDEQLMSLVRDFSASYSGKDEVAWNKLKTIPRTELINRLVQLREKATSEIDRVAIAFLLCNLDFEYKTNKETIIAAFNREPHSKNSGSSWEVDLLDRLIKRGDTSPMPVLFAAAQWSDGFQAEQIAGVFERQLKSDPEHFVLALHSVPKQTREAVYGSFDDQMLTLEEISKIQAYLRSVSSVPGKAQVAKELSTKLSQVESRTKKQEN